MENYRCKKLGLVCGLLIAFLWEVPAQGQEAQYDPPTSGPIYQLSDEVPKAAMLTKRGRQLADRLRHLRYAESTMGAKHPSLKTVQDEIADVKEQLTALDAGAPQDIYQDSRPLPQAVPSMNDDNLRQLVLRMAAKIDQLERRLRALEEQPEIH